MDWFEELTGFKEQSHRDTALKLVFENNSLYSKANQRRYSLGQFELLTLADLRARSSKAHIAPGNIHHRPRHLVAVTQADAYQLHCWPEANGAVIQVASQFNLLEMASPDISPEDGVTRYQYDHTQGPACAMAAGPATLFRNYGVQINSQLGQTSQVQINTLAKLITVLNIRDVQMRNGYAFVGMEALRELAGRLTALGDTEREWIKGLLEVGVHWNTQVTANGAPIDQRVTQVFCSALPIAYNTVRTPTLWEPFARLILEACYEATLHVGVLNAANTGNPKTYLTRVGGGVFGNAHEWIDDAIDLALHAVSVCPLEVIHVTR